LRIEIAGKSDRKMNQEQVPTYSGTELKWPVTILSSEGQCEGEIESINTRGALFSCTDIPPLNETVQMFFNDTATTEIYTGGNIIWSTVLKLGEGDPRLGIGVQFTSMTSNDRQFISTVVAAR
jgi:hypothetical protein